MSKSNIIEAREITKFYGTSNNQIKALGPITFDIKEGSFNVILGRSGSGKSTLLNVLSGLDKITSGSLVVNSKIISKLRSSGLAKYRGQNGVIFQFYHLLPNLNALENILLGSWAAGEKADENQAKELLKRFGLEHRTFANVKTLSGGEKQRVAIARALMGKPKILFCDEPTGALDSTNEKQVEEILLELNKKDGITVIMVTHNSVFENIADNVIHMHDGKILSSTNNQATESLPKPNITQVNL